MLRGMAQRGDTKMAGAAHQVTSRDRSWGPRPRLELVTGGGLHPAPATHRRPSAATHRRRRVAAATLAAAVLLAARAAIGALGGGTLTAPGPAPPLRLLPIAERVHVVQPGDTLWTIGRALQPDGDVRPLVDRLAHEHPPPSLRPGELVHLPL
jgi:hypothetical protein